MNTIDVSVIIPIYKAELYIERCAHSLMNQTLKNIEFIFINDCTPDNSIIILEKILEQYPLKQENIHIIHHAKNRGTSSAKNTGLKKAIGEFIIYCDADDWVEPDMYEKLYNQAITDKADIVTCDFWNEFLSTKELRTEKYQISTTDNIKAMLQAKLHGSNWNKLIKKQLYDEHNITFPEGINMWEDLYTSIRLFYFAKKITYIPKPFYHYNQQNSHSLLSNFSLKKMEEKFIVCNLLTNFFKENNNIQYFDAALKQRELWAKMELITDQRIRDFNQWRKLYPNAQHEIFYSIFSVFNKITFYLVSIKYDSIALALLKIKDLIIKILR